MTRRHLPFIDSPVGATALAPNGHVGQIEHVAGDAVVLRLFADGGLCGDAVVIVHRSAITIVYQPTDVLTPAERHALAGA